MFELALKKMNVSAAETAYFGDSPERDMAGAKKVGMTPFLYNGEKIFENKFVKCTEISSYREIMDSEIFF